jgi:DHA1 family bicyclomycin/chloramphenicol resistance-like MFS transporter
MAMTAQGPVSLNIFIPAVPELVTTLATDSGTVQLTISLFLLSLASGQLVMGPLSDKFGRRPVVLCGLALAAFASIAAVAASSIGMLIGARIIQALGASTGVVIGRAIIRDLYERDRAAAMLGLITTVMVIGPMIAPLIGGILDNTLGWQSIFVFLAIFSIGTLVWAVLALPETLKQRSPSVQALKPQSEWRHLLTSPRFYCYTLIGTFGSAAFFTFIGGAPHVAINIMGATSAGYGGWIATSSFGYMLGNFIVSRLVGRYGTTMLIRWGILVQLFGAGVGTIAIVLAPMSFYAFFLPQIIVTVGSGLLLPNAIAGAISVRPEAAGTAAGIVGFVQMATGAGCAQAISHVLVYYPAALPVSLALLVTTSLAGTMYIILQQLRRDS